MKSEAFTNDFFTRMIGGGYVVGYKSKCVTWLTKTPSVD